MGTLFLHHLLLMPQTFRLYFHATNNIIEYFFIEAKTNVTLALDGAIAVEG